MLASISQHSASSPSLVLLSAEFLERGKNTDIQWMVCPQTQEPNNHGNLQVARPNVPVITESLLLTARKQTSVPATWGSPHSSQHVVAPEHSQVCSPGDDTGQVHPGKNSEQLWPRGFSQPARENLPLGGHYSMKHIRPGKKGHRAHECCAIALGRPCIPISSSLEMCKAGTY